MFIIYGNAKNKADKGKRKPTHSVEYYTAERSYVFVAKQNTVWQNQSACRKLWAWQNKIKCAFGARRNQASLVFRMATPTSPPHNGGVVELFPQNTVK